MRRGMRWGAVGVVACALSARPVQAQSLTGTWRAVSDTSAMAEITLTLVQRGSGTVVGEWAAVRGGCTPVVDACRYRGELFGTIATFKVTRIEAELLPREPGAIGGQVMIDLAPDRSKLTGIVKLLANAKMVGVDMATFIKVP